MAYSPGNKARTDIPMMTATPTKHSSPDSDVDEPEEMFIPFQTYPKTRPFINSDYTQSPTKPIIPFPESSRDGIYSAMKNLQEKVRRLELERTAAEDNLKTLATETTQYSSSILQRTQQSEKLANDIVAKQTLELESQLTAAESRCGMLEKQLDHMRQMVHHSTQEQLNSARRRLELEKQTDSNASSQFRSQLNKISDLEREHLKLTATQSISENKIRELEQKLQQEDIHRKLILQRTAELQARPPSSYITQNYSGSDDIPIKLPNKTKKKMVKKKKKKTVTASEKGNLHPTKKCSKHNDPTSHYRLNLAEIPFVAGKSTGPSHSVGANVQKVISMMKSHNLALCSAMYNGHSQRSPSMSSSSSTNSLDNDMSEILQQLQDEFGQLSIEHEELVNHIDEASDLRVKQDLRRELDRIIRRLETKSQQISKVRSHQQKLAELKKKGKHRRTDVVNRLSPQRPYSAAPRLTSTKQNNTKQTNKNISSPRSAGGAALNVLNDMRKLQTTLRKDDVSWE
ncbi:centrosomal protein of 57 kDa isoform X1 [Patella vulgata]|uniref:centrosomal protein of 57 kDa isoform X1 n=1 Tax=Patella vulgata TaxID=6465 RepID=UPI0024A9A161|nr:centrosomal protein of 57 kDa isoform X1 [Patella vulgata]